MRQYGSFDIPTKQDYLFDISEEFAMGDHSVRPKDEYVVQDQKQSLGCTMFGILQPVNGFNILEDKKHDIGVKRPPIDILDKWQEYCKERGYEAGDSIQNQANRAKNEKLIAGYSTISRTLSNDEQVKKMKLALDVGGLILTGSNNCQRTYTGRAPYIYIIRTDGKKPGHGFALVDYNDIGFIGLNSYGSKRGDKGYFTIPFELVSTLYSKLVLVDADDTIWFMKIKEREQAKEGIRQCKKIYSLGLLSEEERQMVSKIATTLRTKYDIKDSEL